MTISLRTASLTPAFAPSHEADVHLRVHHETVDEKAPQHGIKSFPTKLVALALAATLVGCSSQIKQLPEEAEITVPEQWEVEVPSVTESGEPNDSAAGAEADVHAPVENGWLGSFNDPQLVGYAQQALQGNPDLLGSAAQLKSAIEQVTVTGAQLWPQVSANYRDSETTVKGPASGISNVNGVVVDASGDSSGGTVTTEVRTISAGLDISWEADVWGKLTQRKKSAALTAKAQAETFKAAELSLVANVSRAWFNLATNKLQVDLARQRLESFERTAALIDENYKRGLRSALDVYLSRTDVQVQVSSLADAEFNYLQSLRTFKTLLGEYPDSALEVQATLPELDDSVPAGLPAELLQRRPDIRASQALYEAQIANAKAAHRDRYPSITFSGSIGDSRDDFDALFENDNMVRTLIAGIAQPVFLAGQLKAREQSAVYEAEAAYASLVGTTLNAFQEVEDSLSREQALQAQHDATKEAVKFAQSGLDLALDRYQSGIENYTTVLEAQRRLFDSRRNEINIRNALLQNRIGIHLALGGDFSEIPERDPTNNLPKITAQSE